MARSSKTLPFTIYEDSTSTTSSTDLRISSNQSEDPVARNNSMQHIATMDATLDYETVEDMFEDVSEADEDAEDERRMSALTNATFSTLPESHFESDLDYDDEPRSYRPAMSGRPGFMRAESVRRMQMSSPPPFLARGPRKSISRSGRSRPTTPRSARSMTARESPRMKSYLPAEMEAPKEYPLVLLHITLLTVDLPWSLDSMHDILPASTMETLRRLKAKISETVQQRGILIPHPQHEYELLEERLLEALELQPERITKCGHFRNRESASSYLSADSIGRESDSALGSSIEGSVMDLCIECDHEVKLNRKGVNRTWSIEVFAANGLMRAAAWSAAWSEMERVDVRVTPWISDEDRVKLNTRLEEENAASELALTFQESQMVKVEPVLRARNSSWNVTPTHKSRPSAADFSRANELLRQDLPNIFTSTKDVPVALLLKNYFGLLMHRHNDAFRIWTVLGVFLTFLFSLVMNRHNSAGTHYHFSHNG